METSPRPPAAADASAPPRTMESAVLLQGAREVLILHGKDTYRLKLTGSNKLILTK
jgi:hemin uptake protein HemP